MTDYNSVRNELSVMMNLSGDELDSLENVISSSIAYVDALICEGSENDARAVNLCAARAYLKISLSDSDKLPSGFRAGDVSFTTSSSIDNARELYRTALEECRGIIEANDAFAFKVV